jgi:hypothetical protein
MSEAQAPAPIATGEATSSPVAAPEVAPSKHRVKINDQEIEVEYDELLRGYQKGRSADQRFQEAAKLRKEAQEVQEAFAAGDFKVLSERLKIPQPRLREMSENYLIELLKFDQLSEPEKRALIAERERDELKSEREAEQQKRLKEESARIADQAAEFIDTALGDAIKASGQKVTPITVARIASFLQASLSQDDVDIDEGSVRSAAEKAVKKAYSTLDEEIRTRFSDMSVADAKAILPKRLLDELRKASVNEVLSQDPTWSRKSPEVGAPKPKAKKITSTDEWFAERAKHLG